ncbi:MAG: DUF4226 domain-containing protein [Actinomycetia bacterium]|nr:DUF4226 domain-containing protein [Actinomycetes bacterium]
MGFCEQQVDDLLASLDTLGRFDAPLAEFRPPLQPLPGWVDSAVPTDSGAGAAAAAEGAASLKASWADVVETDGVLAATLNDAHTADAASRTQLKRIHQEIRGAVEALDSTISTPAGRQQLVEFLAMKAAQAKQITDDAQQSAERVAAGLHTALAKYEAVAGPS